MKVFWLFLIVCGVVQDSDPETLPSKSSAQAISPAPAELIETDSRKVAFIEHRGPYWSLGPVIDKVTRDARAMGVRDGLLIRYIDFPVPTSPAGLRAEIGFELAGSELPRPPYKIAQWPRALAARKTVNGPDGLSTRHFTTLKAWANNQGLVPAGDMIAVVELAEDSSSTSIERAEILLPVCVPDPPAIKAPPLLLKSNESESEPNEISEPSRHNRNRRTVTKVIQISTPGSENAADEGSPGIVQAIPAQKAHEQQLAVPVAPTITPAPPAPPLLPIRQWIEEGEFVTLAAALLPDQVDSASRHWADQMAARIVALANGVQKKSPGEEDWLAELSTQLAARRDANRADSHKSPTRVIGPSSLIGTNAVGSNAADRKAVMLELDRLMANVSYRSLNPDQIREELILLLEKLIPLVSP